ncbi:MAG: hypothetical protein HW390_2857 [Candidatus Brocadiaceae bacterium]|nr:hypothetical protein [Candidatus Brocadiaceae bacterium]
MKEREKDKNRQKSPGTYRMKLDSDITNNLESLINTDSQDDLLSVLFLFCRTYAVPFSLAYRLTDVSTSGYYVTV